MPFVLIVPPINIISDNPEFTVKYADKHQKIIEQKLKELGVSEKLDTIKYGGLKGTNLYRNAENYNQILSVNVLYLPGKKQEKDFSIVTVLLRKKECLNLGSNVEIIPGIMQKIPSNMQINNISLKDIAARKTETVTTWRLKNVFTGEFSKRAEIMYEAIISERVATKGVPVISNVNRLYCEWEIPKKYMIDNNNVGDKSLQVQEDVPYVTLYPARAHRLVVSYLNFKQEKDNYWPFFNGQVLLESGIFGERKDLIYESKNNIEFNISTLSEQIVDKLKQTLHNMQEVNFKVYKRVGRWAYLDRGKAYGLEIGTHLKGPGNSELHVIQYAPEEKQLDVAIAIIRREDKMNPVKIGDILSFDMTKYPKSPWPPLLSGEVAPN